MNLEQANKLQQEIKDLEYFLFTVVKFDEKCTFIPAVKVIMKTEIQKKVSFLGSRFFGIGTHKQEINVPNSIRNELIQIANRQLCEKEKQLEEFFDYVKTT